jgi:hypothetical protein
MATIPAKEMEYHYGFNQDEHTDWPGVAKLLSVNKYASTATVQGADLIEQTRPTFTNRAYKEKDANGNLQVLHPATGPGEVWLAPPELEDYNLGGDLAAYTGKLPDGKLPRQISRVGLNIASFRRTNPDSGAEEDAAKGYIGFGAYHPTGPYVTDGWVAQLGGSAGARNLVFAATDYNAALDTSCSKRVVIQNGLYVGCIIEGAGGRILSTLRTSSDVTLTSAHDVVFITGAHVVTLEPSPGAGTRKIIVNETGAARTVARNGNSIDGAAANLSLPAGASVMLVFDSTATDWRIAAAYKHPSSGGSLTFPIEAPDDGVVNYTFDGGTTPGSENAGMGFTPGDEGPSLFDVAGIAQLKVDTTGVEIPNDLHVLGKGTFDGFIDPTGIGFTLGAARPADATTLGNGIWADNDAARRLRWYNGSTDYFVVHNTGATAGDNEIPRFNASGIVIQGSNVFVDDVVVDPTYGNTTNMDTPDNGLGVSNALQFDTGTGVGGTGSLLLGRTNAESVVLGRSGKNTIIQGHARAEQTVNFTGVFAGAAGNDVAIGSVAKARFTSGATLTGMVPTGPVNGQVVLIENATGSTLTVSHDATSTAANRFYCPGSASVNVPANGGIMAVYSTTDSRWRVLSIAEGGGGGGGGLSEAEVFGRMTALGA